MHGKQERYELFLDSVQKKENATLVAAVPHLLRQMTAIVEAAGSYIEHPNWELKTIPRLREHYKQLLRIERTKDGPAVLRAAEAFASELGGWNKHLPFRVLVKRETKNDSRRMDHRAVRITHIELFAEPKAT
jgi:hypothetical protein